MKEQIIGIIGGMGPEATRDLYNNIIRLTHATKDQDHLHTIVDSNPKIPDRTAFIVSNGENNVDGKSIMQMSMLAATHGTKLKIKAQGHNAQQAVDALQQLVEIKMFDEPAPDDKKKTESGRAV